MSTIPTDHTYINTRNIYTGLIFIDNDVYSTLKPISNPIPEPQKTAKTYKLATLCLGLICALLMISTLYVSFKACKQCPQDFVLFNSQCYYFSTVKKSWEDSRNDCKETGADLVVIETEEEQVFIHKHSVSNFWIGLTDSSNEGTWVWVDKSPLNVGYWKDEEPNSYKGRNEDCVHGLRDHNALKSWNDITCNTTCNSVCEKTP